MIDRSLSLLEDLLYAEGVAAVERALVHAVANAGSLQRAKSQCCFGLLKKLSSSESAAGAATILRKHAAESAAALTSSKAAGATTAAETGAMGTAKAEAAPAAATAASATGVATGAAAGFRAGSRAGAEAAAAAGEPPSAFLDTAPAVLGDILVAAALGVDAEIALRKGRSGEVTTVSKSLRTQFAGADWRLVAVCLGEWVRMVQDMQPTAAAVAVHMFNLAEGLLTHIGSTALSGLGRPVGFSCNEPECWNLNGLSEVGLVVPGGRGNPEGRGQGCAGGAN
jgi:hypothetical protein